MIQKQIKAFHLFILDRVVDEYLTIVVDYVCCAFLLLEEIVHALAEDPLVRIAEKGHR